MIKIAPLLPVVVLLTACTPSRSDNPSGSAPVADTSADWIVLFDGTSLDAWRGYQSETIPPCWQIAEDGSLHCTGEGSGDLVTKAQFADFVLELEWKVAPKGNSGIMYRVTEAYEAPWMSGPEYQILDNAGHADGNDPKTSAGACYALYPTDPAAVRPAGEWNHTRIVVDSTHVEHWLNGRNVVTYTLGSDDWNARVAASKFQVYPDFGKARQGHIALQNHGDPVWYRNIRIRPLNP
ncbi:3-keto-disaccharide hydrolase [Rhodothermus bifroesti]|uniref:DUF1080 domain-containing protein n=1 Tax=Rhodothermus marinus TaxID=29549 RepID=A0A7V2F5S0_RHOMR|nr:DUF1080 domain-containing protein [Rhodothermus bifroesti]GBD01824.1 hypothetical protein HRbin18_01553 [bacterium HR18]